jgi:elongation factor G
VRAVIPQAELHLYATELNSMTHGHATFTRHFRGYEEVPPDVAQKIISEGPKKEEVLTEA